MHNLLHRQPHQRSPWAWLLAWLAGIYLVLAAPISLPGGAVERVQANLGGFNFTILLWSDLGSTLLVLAVGAVVGALVYGLVRAVSRMRVRPAADSTALSRWAWLIYALPMLLVWGIYLLAYWPAIMAPDTIVQWRQVVTGHYVSGHPLGHTLLLWLLIQIWDSPSFVALVQIAALAGLVGWELAVLRRWGLPGWAAWGASALFALSPINGALIITLWKDTPYSIALFALALLVLNISLDEETWLHKKGLWLALGAACAGVALFRHNGFLVALFVPLILAWVYRRHWRVFAAALAFFGLCWAFVQWPLDALLKVEKSSIITGSIALHHIGAHIKAGTEMTAEEKDTLNRMLPLNKWVYDCYSINPIQTSPELNEAEVVASTRQLYVIMGNLFMRNPTVNLNHMLCAGSMVYSVFQKEESYMLTTQIVTTPNGTTYLKKNDLGFDEDSQLPGLENVLSPFLVWSGSREVNWFIWRPASWLYVLLLIGVGLMLRYRSWKVGLFLAPALVQSASLFLTNISQSFRYQYPVYLMALFALALLFLPVRRACAKDKKAAREGYEEKKD